MRRGLEMKNVISTLVLLMLCMIAVSCSSNTSPTEPSVQNNGNAETNISTNISEMDIPAASLPRGAFGLWKVMVDIPNMTTEIIPARNARAIGNIFDADLSQFLNVAPCLNCMSIAGMYLDGYENLNLTVRMKHPFANIATRPDLHGFDVRAIFIIPGDTSDANIKVMGTDGVEQDASFNLDYILNADGYTSHFDNLPSDPRYFLGGSDVVGNLNPFLRFFEDYATPTFDPHTPDGHNVMPVGSGNYDRTAVFNSEHLTSAFGFYVVADVSYGQSAVFANRTNPQYYLPAFNRTESWRAEYWIENNNLHHFDPTSTADIVVQVFDWQADADVDPDYPDPSNLSGIPESSDVLRLELSIPQLQDAPVIVNTPEAGYGTPTSPLRYRLTVMNQNGAYVNPTGLLAIRDELYGQASPHGRMPIPESPAGFPYATDDIRDYTLYIPVTVNILNGQFPQYVSGMATLEDTTLMWPDIDTFAPTDGSICSTVIHPHFFQDPSHKKFQYRWDYDYDGVTFDIDGGGNPSPQIDFATSGRKNVGLRIRDNSVPSKEYIYQFNIYAEGEAFNELIPSTEWNRDIASSRRSQAIDIDSNNVYYVYSHGTDTGREIWLAIVNRQGNMTTSLITASDKVCYNPALYVDSSGTETGIYIVYSQVAGSNTYIYSTHGNLDGTGFSSSNRKRITNDTPVDEVEPCILWDYPRFNVFYTRWVGAPLIYGAWSNDDCETWNEYGWVADNGSTWQENPAACETSYGNSMLIWEDYMDEATTGADLYKSRISNGTTFQNPVNISIFHDQTYETKPSIDYGYYQVAIAYLTYKIANPEKSVRLKILDAYYDSQLDFPIDYVSSPDTTYTQPCVYAIADCNFTYSFGTYDTVTHDLSAWVFQLYKGDGMNQLEDKLLFHQDVGTVPATFNGAELFPAVACYRYSSSAIENFVFFRNYVSGSYLSPQSPQEVCGQISVVYEVSEHHQPD